MKRRRTPVKTPVTRRPAHPLTPDQALRLIAACPTRTRAGIRDRALIVVLYRAGLRCCEALSLRMQDVRDEGEGLVIRVEKPKGFARGALPRELGLDGRASQYIRAWLEIRGGRGEMLFPNAQGGEITPAYVRNKVRALGLAAQLNRRVHPHALRHSFARELHDEGVSLPQISYALGHSSLATTTVYLASIGATEVVATTLRRTWGT